MRLSLQEDQNVIAIHFDTDSLFGSHRLGFMRNLLQHGSEAEEFAWCRLLDDNFLVVFIHRGDAHSTGDDDIGAPARIADLVDALPGKKCF